MNLSQAEIKALYTMLKGEPGTRKSTQALSYLKMGKMYWFSWDRKMQALLLPAQKWGLDLRNIEYDDYNDWDKARARLERFQVSKDGFQTLVFDSVTSMADMTLRQQRKGKGTAGKKLGTIDVDGIEEYNAESAALNELIALTKDIHNFHKMNIILIAHVVQAEYRNTTTNTTHVSRTIVTAGKKIAAKIPAYCEEVYHFNIKKGIVEGQGGKYTLLTSHTGDDFARTMLPVPNEIEFGESPLYGTWIEPAISKLMGDSKETQSTITNNSTSVSQPTTSKSFTG